MKPEQNLDQHLFSEEEGNHFSPKCFMTKDRKLGIDVGGYVPVRSLSEWMEALQLKEMKKFENNLADKGYLYQCGTDHPVSGIKPKEYCDQCGNTGFSLFDGKKCVHKYKFVGSMWHNEFPNPEPNFKKEVGYPPLKNKVSEAEVPNAHEEQIKKITVWQDKNTLLNKREPQESDFVIEEQEIFNCGEWVSLLKSSFIKNIGEKLSKEFNEVPNVHTNKGLDVNIQDQPILKQIEHYQRLIQDSWHKINKLIRESEEK